MSLEQTLFRIERELGEGDGDAYRRHLTDDAVVVVPGQALSKSETIEAMDASPGWDELAFEEERAIELEDGVALLTYRFSGRRGEVLYSALMGSVYVEREGSWKLAFHQQTPLE